ncbi:MAG: hypothetical protein ABIM50_12660 [Novosphingobium sp.]
MTRLAGKAGTVARSAASRTTKAASAAKSGAVELANQPPGPSPNSMTNLVIADIALRSGGQLLRHAVERTLLGLRYPQGTAKRIVKGRSMTTTLLGTAAARIAMRSVPGALLVGGGLLAKTLFDRRQSRRKAKAEGEAAVARRIENS